VLALLGLLALALGGCGFTTLAPGPAGSVCPADGGLSAPAYSPTQMRQAYGLESLCQQGTMGQGQTVVVIDSFGSPTLQQDLNTFSQRFKLPQLTLDIRAPLGSKPFDYSDSEMTGWATETTLDVETIHAMAPAAHIVVLTSPVDETEGVVGLPEFRQLEQYAVQSHLGTIISQSFGASEISLDDAAGHDDIGKWTSFYQDATTKQGITFVASSGDGGATDYANAADAKAGRLAHMQTIGFPADNPWVLAVGGTSLTVQGSGAQEVAWTDSEGGFSRFYAEPSYQQLLPSSAQGQLGNRRGVPDVAGSADPSRGLAIYMHFQPNKAGYGIIGGTSASAPLWAGILAVGAQVAGHPLGYVNPAIYKLGTGSKAAQDFRDITSGNNSQPAVGVQGFSAGPGWDPVTGFGSPNAGKLLPDLVAALSAT
jgi:subtilase family serine protease